jgi:hypothetical protein
MKFVRSHRSLIAWMLYAFILFNGLACSFGHGQMISSLFEPSTPGAAHDHHAAMSGSHAGMSMDMDMDMSASSGKMDMNANMAGMFGDCSFAGSLTLAMVFFVALGWLIRSRQPRFSLPPLWLGRPARHAFPGLNPQAP